jgi:hypothetical protein
MANITYRASTTPPVPVSTTVKNTLLTHLEVDGNFKSLNDDIQTRSTAAALAIVASDALAMAIAMG